MTAGNQRNTVQRGLVLDAVRSLGNHPTSEEVYLYIIRKYPSISKSTVYRNLDKLCENGELLRIPVAGGADHVDHMLSQHYHLVCSRCGRVFDIKTDKIPDMTKNITDARGCLVTDFEVVFNGLCPDCNNLLRKEVFDNGIKRF